MAEQNSYIVRGNDICFGLDGVTVPWGVVTSVKRKPSRSSENSLGNPETRNPWSTGTRKRP